MFRYIKYFITILALCTFIYPIQANAATITASSCSLSDVQSAISSANSGDTVVVPSGTATWTSTLAITKSITLIGAGIGQTVITCTGGTGISYSITGDVEFNLSGFTLIDDDKTNYGLYISNASITDPIYNLKVHHNKFQNWRHAIKPHGMIYGVIYENEFSGNVYDAKPLGSPAMNQSWTLFPGAANVGTKNYLYFEDNTSTGATLIILASGEGARWVYRHNTVDANSLADKMFDAHGDTRNRGVVAHEFYENTLTNVGTRLSVAYRGGVGINFNNKYDSINTFGGRSRPAEDYGSCTNPGGCDGSPCGDEVNNGYIWNNTNANSDIVAIEINDAHDCIAEDANWWDDYNDSNFDTGLSSSRPGTCSDDDCYWETDTKKLYRCDGANNWTFIYTPYTYPHPIRGEGILAPVQGGRIAP